MINYAISIILSTVVACSAVVKQGGENMSNTTDTLGVMSFNMWMGGLAGGQPVERSAEVIRLSGAEVVGLQESKAYNADGSLLVHNGAKLAEILGWYFFEQQGSNAIISRYPIADSTAGKLGVKLRINNNRYIWVFNCHLFHMPYQPYQLAGKPYGDFPFINTEKEAISFAKATREADVSRYVAEIKKILSEGWPVMLTGDFNEPSFQDWSEKAVQAGLRKLKVVWPATKAFADLGMKDAYRLFYADEVKFPGETWSSIDEPGEIHDRIDFVLYHGKQIKVIDAQTMGKKDGKSGIGMQAYPSDHRAVFAKFIWNAKL